MVAKEHTQHVKETVDGLIALTQIRRSSTPRYRRDDIKQLRRLEKCLKQARTLLAKV